MMKREEKNQQTRRRIMDSALAEFSGQGYGASSINTICAAQNISKGIVYHYFATKDALFLACVEECFRRLTDYIRENLSQEGGTPEAQLRDYFALRTAFFREAPVYQRIFCDAVVAPPVHLRREIQAGKADFDALNLKILEDILRPLPLRPDVSRADVMETFRQFQDFINIRCQMTDTDGRAFALREESCQKALNILLYGVVKREES
nr:TetR/AcrR family transcriptional regulator [uncultured Oscillibacter sp.]